MPLSVTITDIVIDRMFLLQVSDPNTDSLQWAIQAVYSRVDASGKRYGQFSRLLIIPPAHQAEAQNIHDAVYNALKNQEGI